MWQGKACSPLGRAVLKQICADSVWLRWPGGRGDVSSLDAASKIAQESQSRRKAKNKRPGAAHSLHLGGGVSPRGSRRSHPVSGGGPGKWDLSNPQNKWSQIPVSSCQILSHDVTEETACCFFFQFHLEAWRFHPTQSC